jgi:ABC-type amino acid transport substrate-binding protein
MWIGGTLALLLAMMLALLLRQGQKDDGSLDRIQARGELRVGLDASFPPFETLDAQGNVVGFDADLAHAIASSLQAEPVFVNIGFDGLYDALLAGRVDVIISGLPYDPRRTQDVIYSQSYFNAGQMLLVRADDAAILDSEPLAGKTVAVEWGSLADMEARRLKEAMGEIQILPQPTARDALGMLVNGQADVAIADGVSAHQFIGEGGEIRIVEALTDEPYVIAVRAKSPRLAKAVDEALTGLRESGQLHALVDEWF